jgi:WD40 repeat protein
MLTIGAVGACVGDDPATGGDGAMDATPPDSTSTNDAAVIDSGSPDVEAPGPACDLSKPFGAPVRIDELDSPVSEERLGISEDRLTAVFGRNNGSFDLELAVRGNAGAPWSVIGNAYPNTGADETSPSLSADGKTLFFARTTTNQVNVIYKAFRGDGGTFGDVQEVVQAVDSATSNHQLYFVAPKNVLYFVRSAGSNTLMRADLNTTDPPSPQTGVDQPEYPAVTGNELRLYFAQVAPQGNYQIYTANRALPAAGWSDVKPVAELVSVGIDKPAYVTANGCTLTFSRVLPKESGDANFYSVTKPK